MVALTDPYEAADAPLREKEARLIAELDAVRKSRAAIASARDAGGYGSSPSAIVSGPLTTPPPTIADKFKGMGLEVAATLYLSESDQIELTAKQIWSGLAGAGFTLLSDRPEQSVSWALRKRENKEKDVILVGDGKWGMVKWYSQARLRDLRASRNNASTRNHAEHVAKTKAGIANAKQNRLIDWGPRRKITGENMTLAYTAYQAGAKSKLALARAGKMSWPSFAYYWQAFEMENWRPGDAFPPPRRATPKINQEILFENMWPRENGRANGRAKDNEPQLTLRPAE